MSVVFLLLLLWHLCLCLWRMCCQPLDILLSSLSDALIIIILFFFKHFLEMKVDHFCCTSVHFSVFKPAPSFQTKYIPVPSVCYPESGRRCSRTFKVSLSPAMLSTSSWRTGGAGYIILPATPGPQSHDNLVTVKVFFNHLTEITTLCEYMTANECTSTKNSNLL